MPINRAPFNALVDYNGSNELSASLWNKAAIAGVILDPADAAYASVQYGAWTPSDQSGAGLPLTIRAAQFAKIGRLVAVFADLSYPTTGNASPSALGVLPFPNVGPLGGFYMNYFITYAFYLGTGQVAFNVMDAATGAIKTNAQLSGAIVCFSGVYLTT